MAREVAITRDDNPLAVQQGRRWFLMNLQHNVGMGTNRLNPNNTVGAQHEGSEHGELGVLQRFTGTQVLVGGGRISGGSRAVEPNSVGLSGAMASLLAGENLVRETRGL